MKNYYKVMGLKLDATDEQIKKTYRELAKQYHPDMHPGDVEAQEKFAEISEAYETLGDKEKRAAYDKQVQEAMAAKAQAQQAHTQQAQQAQQARAHGNVPPEFARAYRDAFVRANGTGNAFTAAYNMAANAQAAVFNRGYEKGVNDAKVKAEQVIATYKHELEKAKTKLVAAEKQIADYEAARRTEEARRKADEAEAAARAAELVRAVGEKENAKQMHHRIEKMTEELSAYAARVDRAQAERRYYEEQYNNTKAELAAALEELELVRGQLASWEEYGKTLDAEDDIERAEIEWERLERGYKKKSKPTYYGTLGVLFIATPEEIETAYKKLSDRYKKKAGSDEAATEKLHNVETAYKTLSDPEARTAYDAEVGFTEEEKDEARSKQAEYAEKLKSLYEEKDRQEFKAYLEDLTCSAQTGDAEAQNTLGELYYYGDEIDADLEQAVYWFKEAAKQRHAEAMFNLGRCFLEGAGVEKDLTRGRGFIKQAAALGSKSAAEYKES